MGGDDGNGRRDKRPRGQDYQGQVQEEAHEGDASGSDLSSRWRGE